MRVDAFDFDLPRELIAQRPARPRHSARLLDVRAQGVGDLAMIDLPDLTRPGDVMAFNDTRVIPARLTGERAPARAGGPTAKVGVTLHMALGTDTWAAFVKGAGKLAVGQSVVFDAASGFAAEVIDKRAAGEVFLRFNVAGPALRRALETHGRIPLPPYIAREDDARDREDYQTVYAARDGAVAAPTAGLHLTPQLFSKLDAKGVRRVHVTLHVGAGTFLPVKAAEVEDHKMHPEWGEITPETATAIAAARAAGGRLICVGTTTLRLIESAAREDGTIAPFSGTTDIFITPGYRFKAADMLATNFHLPRSTLFMLVCAFAGTRRMKAAYRHAIECGYRFYSYGDGSLLRRAKDPR